MNIQNRATLAPSTDIARRTPSESLLVSENSGTRLARIPPAWAAPVTPRTIGLHDSSLTRAIDDFTKSEGRVRAIIDAIPVIAWCTLPDGSGEFWNQRWHDYTGLSKEGARGWGWQTVVHPDDLGDVTRRWLTDLAFGQAGEVEGRLRRFDGEYRWFLFRYEPLRDASGNIVNWLGTDTDIEDRKRSEQKLHRYEQESLRLTDAIPHLIHLLAPDGRTLYANQALLDYAGLSLDDVQPDDFRAKILHPEDLERASSQTQKALALGVSFEIEQRVRRKDGQYRWLIVRHNPQKDEQGQIIRWYATATEVDDRTEAPEQPQNENLVLREEIAPSSMFEDIVGSSPSVRRMLSQVAMVAPTDSTVLILGETGTGKELIARALHRRSNRSARPFVRVNCAAIPQSLIASELFGHEKGSFTGALQRRLGRFEAADGGTLFLDEVGDLPMETQIALLRVLQEREFERVGGNQPISVNVRIVAATNRDLKAAVAAGTFRQDLFYRLNVFPLQVPALRDRVADIPLLVEYFIARCAAKARKRIGRIGKSTMELLKAYGWPGNIRELENVVERGVILSDTETFSIDESWLKRESPTPSTRTDSLSSVADREIEIIEAALTECRGRVSGPAGAAAKLRIPRQTLESRIKSLGIDKYRLRSAALGR